MASGFQSELQPESKPEADSQCPLCRKLVTPDTTACGRCGTDLSLLVELRAKAMTLKQRGDSLASSGDRLGARLAYLQAKSLWPLARGEGSTKDDNTKQSRAVTALVTCCILEAILLAMAVRIILQRG